MHLQLCHEPVERLLAVLKKMYFNLFYLNHHQSSAWLQFLSLNQLDVTKPAAYVIIFSDKVKNTVTIIQKYRHHRLTRCHDD